MNFILDFVAPVSLAEATVASVIDGLLDVVVRETYAYESERVAAAIVDWLIDRASQGHYGGGRAMWEVTARHPRSGQEWVTRFPAIIIKVRGGPVYDKGRWPVGVAVSDSGGSCAMLGCNAWVLSWEPCSRLFTCLNCVFGKRMGGGGRGRQ
jgi:hypothetical protein